MPVRKSTEKIIFVIDFLSIVNILEKCQQTFLKIQPKKKYRTKQKMKNNKIKQTNQTQG